MASYGRENEGNILNSSVPAVKHFFFGNQAGANVNPDWLISQHVIIGSTRAY